MQIFSYLLGGRPRKGLMRRVFVPLCLPQTHLKRTSNAPETHRPGGHNAREAAGLPKDGMSLGTREGK